MRSGCALTPTFVHNPPRQPGAAYLCCSREQLVVHTPYGIMGPDPGCVQPARSFLPFFFFFLFFSFWLRVTIARFLIKNHDKYKKKCNKFVKVSPAPNTVPAPLGPHCEELVKPAYGTFYGNNITIYG